MPADEPTVAVVDLETTGFAPPEHVPVEIGWCLLTAPPDLIGAPDWARAELAHNGPHHCLIDPGRPMPPEASAIHHLIDDDLRGQADWPLALRMFRADAGMPFAYAAHSAAFERQFLTPELIGEAPWLCTYKCALRAWPEAPGHSNQALRYWLRPQGLRREMATPAHRAGPDAYATTFLLRELLRRHPIATLLQWSGEPAVLVRVPFGRRPEEGGWRGERWSAVDDGFLAWVAARDFSESVLHTVGLEIARRAAAVDTADDE